MSKKGTSYSAQEKGFITDNWQDMTDAEIGKAIGRPTGGVTAQRQKMGFTNYSRTEWTAREEAIVKKHYADTANPDILELIDHDMQSLYRKANQLGLNKSADFMARQRKRLGEQMAASEASKATRFKKGHESFNKGKKQEEFMSPEAIERTKKTRFGEGHTPANTKYDGAITLRRDTETQRPYLWIRISADNWVMYHVHLWEQACGPVPDGHIITFIDGNSMKCRLENLECISRAEHARRNQDWKKAMATMKRKGNHPSKNLTDKFVASMLAGHDEQIKQHLLAERPGLIKVARANYQLSRKIREVANG